MNVKYVGKEHLGSKGFFIIEHIPTGRLHADTSLHMGKELDRIFGELNAGKYPRATFQKLHNAEPTYKVYLHAESRIDEAKKRLRAFQSQRASYLWM